MRALAIVAAALLVACDEGPLGTSLFPLEAGRSWSYRVESSNAAGVRTSARRVEVVGEASIHDDAYRVRRWSDGVDFYLREDERGIYRRAVRTFIETEPRVDAAPRYVLKAPYTVGTDWTHDSRAYLLWRPGPDKYDYTRQHTVQMTYTIVGTDESVTVPAGHFVDCVLVEGEAALVVYTDPATGTVTVPVTTREWYAPGVGLVKAERIEELDSSAVKGGEWRMELVAFE